MSFFFPFQCKTCSEPKQITSSSAIYDNPNLIKPIPVKPSENQQQRIPRPSQVWRPLLSICNVSIGLVKTFYPEYSQRRAWCRARRLQGKSKKERFQIRDCFILIMYFSWKGVEIFNFGIYHILCSSLVDLNSLEDNVFFKKQQTRNIVRADRNITCQACILLRWVVGFPRPLREGQPRQQQSMKHFQHFLCPRYSARHGVYRTGFLF